MKDAVVAGFDFNGVANGVPAVKYHGPHNEYTNRIEQSIIEWKRENPNYTPQQAREFIEDLANQNKRIIEEHGGVVSIRIC